MKNKFVYIVLFILLFMILFSIKIFAVINPNSFVYENNVYTIPEETCKNYSYYLLYRMNSSDYYPYRFFVSETPIIYDIESGIIKGKSIVFSSGRTIEDAVSHTFDYVENENAYISSSSLGNNILLFSNADILDANGEVVFQHPLVTNLAPIVKGVETEKALEEVVLILPIILLIIVGLIGLRKGLRMLSTVLRQS